MSDVGAEAEGRALAFLLKRRLALLAQNFRCRHGEVDLVMQDGGCVVFVEVRRRRSLVAAAASVDDFKQRRLQAAAAFYLGRHGGDAPPVCRFDVVLVDARARVRWIRGAFEAEGGVG